jgi:PAS domain S-box-containing protein
MTSDRHPHRARRTAALVSRHRVQIARLALVCGVYVGTAKLGLALAYKNSSVTAVWPPTGVALAAILIWGYRMWPAVALGAVLANSWLGVGPVSVLAIATGNTLEAVAGAYLLRLVRFRASLERVRDVVALFALGGMVSTIVSSTIGVSSLYIGGRLPFDEILSTWQVWWLGDMGGDLLIAPVLLLAMTCPRPKVSPGRVVEAAMLLAAVALMGMWVFSHPDPYFFLLFPPLLWAALRFGHAGAAFSCLAVATVAVVFTHSGSGPFTQGSPDSSLLLSQSFMGVAAVTALLLAVLTSEQKSAEDELREARENLEQKVHERTAELERSNAELRRNESQLADSQRIAHLGSWEWDIAANAVHWSEELRRIHGVEPATFDASYEAYLEAVHPDDRELVAGIVRKALEDGAPFDYQYRCVRPDNEVRVLHAQGQLERRHDGSPLRMFGTCLDVTELRRMEEPLRHLAAIVESSRDAIFSKSRESMITSWNPGAERLFGYAPKEIIGRPVSVLIPPDRRIEEEAIMAKILSGEGIVNYETERLAKDRARIDVSVTVSPIVDEEGTILGCSSITRDIREQKRIQEEADRLKDEFFATVSHELRTPLTSIIGYTDLLLEEGAILTDQQRRFLEITERNARRQLRLVGDMLFVTKAEAGEFSIKLGSVDLHALLKDCVDAASPAADAKKIKLVYSGAPVPRCEADGDRLAQLADNLISNAIKFTPEGGKARVQLLTYGGEAILEVSNSGSHVSAAERERLFDRFYRTDRATKDAVQGVGLGLTISKAIVTAHGGTIAVESDPETGTTFRVRLPLRESSKVIDLAARRGVAA